MSSEEKGAWVLLIVAVGAYAVYLSLVLGGSAGLPLAEVPFVVPMLWTIGGAIVAGIVLNIFTGILTGMFNGGKLDKKDARDREIGRIGDHIGQWFVVIGAVGALILAMLEVPYFWIANVIYLGFVLSGIVSSVAKIIAYRRGFQTW